jgi:flavin reductase (DIM6/NTAB) family NADH-FMN oxidoreductase RutF
MAFTAVNTREIDFNPFAKIDGGCLITAGTPENFNTMTASWGFTGIMWTKNVFTTVIRPNRYTYEFAEKYETFTASFFNKEIGKKILSYCGSHSGRDVDKCKETGITPISLDGGVTFEQAELVFVCKKVYVKEMDIEAIAPDCRKYLGTEPVHTEFIGEIISAYKNN